MGHHYEKLIDTDLCYVSNNKIRLIKLALVALVLVREEYTSHS